MEQMEWRTRDKSAWGAGPWQDEPDKKQWTDADTGLACLVLRGPHGGLCGYVGVPKGHCLHGLDYSACPLGSECVERSDERTWCDHTPEHRLSVHGGITFAGGCAPISREQWEKMKGRAVDAAKDARRYPIGDAARWLAEWAGTLDSYGAWETRARASFICHVPGAGEPDDVWWFGFDCAHAGDYSPQYDADRRSDPVLGLGAPTGWGGVIEYRDMAYVQAQVAGLAAQLATI